MNKPNADATSFNTKWLIEGPAAVVEGIYIQQHYNEINNDMNKRNSTTKNRKVKINFLEDPDPTNDKTWYFVRDIRKFVDESKT